MDFGIGIRVGQAAVGNVGSMRQMNYTAIGNAVNLAKRLQEYARAGEIVLSQAAHEAVRGHVLVREAGPMLFRGRVMQEHVYSVLGFTENRPD